MHNALHFSTFHQVCSPNCCFYFSQTSVPTLVLLFWRHVGNGLAALAIPRTKLLYGCCSSWGYGVLTCRCASALHTHTSRYTHKSRYTVPHIVAHSVVLHATTFMPLVSLRWLRHKSMYEYLLPLNTPLIV